MRAERGYHSVADRAWRHGYPITDLRRSPIATFAGRCASDQGAETGGHPFHHPRRPADDALKESAGIADIGATLASAQGKFKQWADPKNGAERKVQTLLENLDSGFFKLLDELTIARSRKHVTSHYDVAAIGKFPERTTPVAEHARLDLENHFPSYDRLHRDIGQYKLSLYNPSEYVQPCFASHYDIKTTAADTDKGLFNEQKTRERYLIGMMRVNFLKRLESSVQSFAITMARTIDKIDALLQRINHFDENRGDYVEPAMFDTMDDDELEALREEYSVGRKLRFEFKHLDLDRWRAELQADRDQLCGLYGTARSVTPERDGKLAKLKDVIAGKMAAPINPGNRKVLVFTAFADTAAYLYGQLAPWIRDEFGIHAALVSGGTAGDRGVSPLI